VHFHYIEKILDKKAPVEGDVMAEMGVYQPRHHS